MTVHRLGSFTALLLTAGLALGQGAPKKDAPPKEPSKPAPGSLEETLEKALRNSADIKSAEAKVREAEAELNRVRQQVLTRATAVHSDLKLARRMLAVAEQTLQAANFRGAKVGAGGNADAIDARAQAILAAEAMIERHRGEVEKLETELRSLRGEFALRYANITGMAVDPTGRFVAGEGHDGTVRVWELETGRLLTDLIGKIQPAAPAPAVQGSMADRVRKLLDQEVTFKASNVPLETALRELLAEAKSDVPVRVILQQVQAEARVELPPGKLPVGAWIQALEDSDPMVVVVVRDYGLLLTTRDRIPGGALRVQDLWKGNYAPLKKDEPKGAEKK